MEEVFIVCVCFIIVYYFLHLIFGDSEYELVTIVDKSVEKTFSVNENMSEYFFHIIIIRKNKKYSKKIKVSEDTYNYFEIGEKITIL